MITEDYVSFETAKLMKEKGFDKDVDDRFSPHFAYNEDGNFSGPSWDTKYNAPTLQLARKWLREKHHLHIEIRITLIKYYWVMCDTETGRWCDESTIYTVKAFDTPEEAEENAIRHALENITQKDNNPSV